MFFFILLSLFAHATGVFAAPYIVTSYVVVSVYTYDAGYTDRFTTYPESLETLTQDVVPATDVSAITTITNSAYTDVTILEVVVPTGKAISYDYNYDVTSLETTYIVPITYSALPTCTSQNWTWATTVSISIPYLVSPTPVSTSLSTMTYFYANGNPAPTSEVVALLNPTDVDAVYYASLSSDYRPYEATYCYTPTSYCETPVITGSAAECTTTFVYDSKNSQNHNKYYGYYDDNSWILPLVLIAVLVPVGWFLIWLIVGLWESWMSFKGLMLGQHRKRGLPYAWCCISFIFLCWVGPTYKAKGIEEQAELLEKWKAMKKREKFRLWLKWGFRWKYPDMLGEEPELAKRAFRQGCL